MVHALLSVLMKYKNIHETFLLMLLINLLEQIVIHKYSSTHNKHIMVYTYKSGSTCSLVTAK